MATEIDLGVVVINGRKLRHTQTHTSPAEFFEAVASGGAMPIMGVVDRYTVIEEDVKEGNDE